MLIFLLAACSAYSLGGDETDGFDGPTSFGGPAVNGFTASNLDTEDTDTGDDTGDSAEEPPLPLTAVVTGSDAAVRHRFTASCGTTFGTPTVDEVGPELVVDYHSSEGDASSMCDWDLSYTLCFLPLGTWELVARDDRTTITVRR